MLAFLKHLDSLIWGPPLLLLLLGTGIYLSYRLRWLQLFRLKTALALIGKPQDDDASGEISSFAALSTALAATVGTGNIVGVATAIKMGGPGALFWMLLAGFLGMATKYAEGFLAIKYRQKESNGDYSGGPMYYIVKGIGPKWKPLAQFFAFSGVLAALFGIGSFTQVNAITEAVQNNFELPSYWTSFLLAILTGLIIFGGIRSISSVSSKVVPLMAGFYILTTIIIIAMHADRILPTIQLIWQSAFTGHAATGGFLGASMVIAMQSGIARGIFSNESGLGSAPIAAAAAKSNQPVEQGLISMTGTFIDTLIICHLTGFAILVTSSWQGDLNGAVLTQSIFSDNFGPIGTTILTICLILFAFTTILGWSYYGERCINFLFGAKFIFPYRIIFVAMILLGGFLELEIIWIIADIANALMAMPNLIAILLLSPIIVSDYKAYFKK
ncbi:alanine/glycine:cation symporter family protein [Streptococcus zalophi]|uniref:Sodium:alanine symporter family protein n=1 Tax=Streptococcus zalophi TaxID=640031 RepID=A0A934PAY7_9STRE|nr:sodium:alanine symporter family protein [Streptococcus zalophi]MBJ8350302.1 sodium:alanine symporter family protein [Streptococcus zalophi]